MFEIQKHSLPNRNQMTSNVYPHFGRFTFDSNQALLNIPFSKMSQCSLQLDCVLKLAHLLSLDFLDHLITCDQRGSQVEAPIY